MSRTTSTLDPFLARIPFIDAGVDALAASARRGIKASVRRWQKRKTIRALERLSDWVLRDIGVARADIPRLAENLVAEDLIAEDTRPAELARTAASGRRAASARG